jgi:hypothetical protein
MRKMGMSPLPPGRSRLQDRMKGQGMKLPVALAREARELKEKIKGKK